MNPEPCPSCGKPPTVRELPVDYFCECLGCVDADCHGSGYVVTTPRGTGKTPALAIEDWNDAVRDRGGE